MSAQLAPVFAALGDPTRLQVLTIAGERGGATATSIAGRLPVTRPAVVKHLSVLERVGLVRRDQQGRDVRFHVVAEPLESSATWLIERAAMWESRLASLKALAERTRPV